MLANTLLIGFLWRVLYVLMCLYECCITDYLMDPWVWCLLLHVVVKQFYKAQDENTS